MADSIDIRLNGENASTRAATVAELLAELQLEGRRVAVLLNGEIARRGDHSTTGIREGDAVEIVTLVGGG